MDITKIEEASKASDEGTWKDARSLPGVRLKVRSANHPVVKRAIGRALRQAPEGAYNEDGNLTDEGSVEIDRAIYPDAVLLDWEGVEADGKAWPCTRENAARAVQSSLMLEAIREAAFAVSVEQKAQWENLAGNSQAPSRPKTRASK